MGFTTYRTSKEPIYVRHNLIEEDVIKAWNEDVSAAASVDVESKVSQAVRKQAAKFIEWLDESDDEDSD